MFGYVKQEDFDKVVRECKEIRRCIEHLQMEKYDTMKLLLELQSRISYLENEDNRR